MLSRSRPDRTARLARRLALGVVATAGAFTLLAPHAVASPQSDAQSAIDATVNQIQNGGGDADKGFNQAGLGEKQGDATAAGDGFVQSFTGGKIFWSQATGAKVLYGAILDKYETSGGPTGDLKFPKTNEKSGPFQPASRAADFNTDDAASIYWTPETGAYIVRGAMGVAASTLGNELGAPLGDATVDGDVVTQKFANGDLTFNTKTGEWGSIDGKLNGLLGKLGGIKIPGLPNLNVKVPGMPGLPNVSAPNMPNISAPNMPNISAPNVDINAPKVDTGFNWWWLWIPLLILAALLLLAWLWRKLRGGKADLHINKPNVDLPNVKKPNVNLPDVDLKKPNIDLPDVDVKGNIGKVAGGVAAAGAAGVAGAAALGGKAKDKVKDALDVDAPDVDINAPKVDVDAPNVDIDGPDVSGSARGLVDKAADKAGSAGSAVAAGAAAVGATKYKLKGVEVDVPKGAKLFDGSKDAPAGYPIKGNADSGLYHTPDSSGYAQTIPEIWFATEADAQAAGYSKPKG